MPSFFVFIESEETVKIVKFRKIIDKFIDNPCVMASSDVYAAGRDYGYDDAEASELVEAVFKDSKMQMVFSSVFRSGFYRALISVQNRVEEAELKEKQSIRKIRAKEFFDVLPEGIARDLLFDRIRKTLEVYENEGR